MIEKREGFKLVSFGVGTYKGGLYFIESGGAGVYIKPAKNQ